MTEVDRLTFATWTTKRDSNGAWYVEEKIANAPGHTLYGPMPEAMVDPLILERREVVMDAVGCGRGLFVNMDEPDNFDRHIGLEISKSLT